MEYNAFHPEQYGIKKTDAFLGMVFSSTGKYLSKDLDDSGIEGARKIAWANARIDFFQKWIEEFAANDQTWGSNADTRISETKSIWDFITEDQQGNTPLVQLKLALSYDVDTKAFTAFGLYYIRKDDIINRLNSDYRGNTEARKKFEFYIDEAAKKRGE